MISAVVEKALVQPGVDLEMLDGLDVALVVTDVNGRIFLWNRAAERLYGYPRDRMLGADVLELFVRPEDLADAGDIMGAVLAGRTWTGEFRVRCADGGSKPVRITDVPLLRDGVVVGVAGCAEEVGGSLDGVADRDAQLLSALSRAGLTVAA
jgi:PAS domain S-box-containing protein